MKFVFTILFFVSGIYLSAQTNISGVINSYAKVDVVYYSCPDSLLVDDASGFSPGDSILIVQMQGALIDSSNSVNYGSVISYDKCGNFEMVKIGSISGNTIQLTSSLMKLYDPAGKVQIISYPGFTKAIVADTLTSQPWNGNTGGILAFSVSDSLILNSDIILDGKGFSGGSVSPDFSSSWNYNYAFGISPGSGGMKGEGIASYCVNMEFGRGPQSNGGGGGNDMNSGGAGGANYGNGGHGGSNCLFVDSMWGMSGISLDTVIDQNRIFLGGGGGGGHQDSSAGTSGGNGGGIIFIRANVLAGNNHYIRSNGNDVLQIAGNDGAGGGGGGGTILLNIGNFTTNIFIEAKGGKGGDQDSLYQCKGNGGGGGGGVIHFSGIAFPSNVSANVSGGAPGAGLCGITPYSAIAGDSGIVKYRWSMPQLVVANAGPNASVCAGSPIQIGTPPVSGMQYSWNNGSTSASQVLNPVIDTILILSVTDGFCHYGYDTINISVYPVPVPSYTFNMRCNTVAFNNTSGPNTYQWNFGDGATSNVVNPVHSYQNNGTYQVDLVITNSNNCTAYTSQIITVNSNQQPAMAYNFVPCDSVYYFQNQSLNPIASQWKFGDGTTSTGLNVFHTYTHSGSKTVQLITTSQNGCIDTVNQNIFVVIETPAKFEYYIDSCASKVLFTSKSPNALSYSWDFGDNKISTQRNPVHTYESEGIYPVTLTVNNGTVCPKSITIDVGAPADGLFTVYIPNSFTPNGDGINDIYKIVSKLPCDEYNLTIYDRWGSEIFKTDDPLNVGWDGTHNGLPVAEGDYVYYLIGTKSKKAGNLIITR